MLPSWPIGFAFRRGGYVAGVKKSRQVRETHSHLPPRTFLG